MARTPRLQLYRGGGCVIGKLQYGLMQHSFWQVHIDTHDLVRLV